MRFALVLAFAAASFAVPSSMKAQSAQEDEPEANPGRPTVSNPATLTPVGYLQFETGILGATDSPEFCTRYEYNETTKLTVSPRIMFVQSVEPEVYSTTDRTSGNAPGEVFLGAQVV